MSKFIIRIVVMLTTLCLLSILLYIVFTQSNMFNTRKVGDQIDSFNTVAVYYNGSVSNVEGRRVVDGYNVGLKYQCVEFVKRYYLEALDHKMPDSYGHTKSFYNPKVSDGNINKHRNLIQYKNGSTSKPKVNDILVYDGTRWNSYGHVAIISEVTDSSIEIIQQNPGIGTASRDNYTLELINGKWLINKKNILGWLRK